MTAGAVRPGLAHGELPAMHVIVTSRAFYRRRLEIDALRTRLWICRTMTLAASQRSVSAC